jgi:hypothetical protein
VYKREGREGVPEAREVRLFLVLLLRFSVDVLVVTGGDHTCQGQGTERILLR